MIKVKFDKQAGTITWQAISEDGKSVAGTEDVVALVSGYSQELKDRAMYHGLIQRGTDAGALGMGNWDGKDKPRRYATDQEKMARIRKVVEHLNSPGLGWDWDLRGNGSGDPLAGKSAEQLAKLIEGAKLRLQELGIKTGE